ncbi:fibroblast growth factor receptor [Aplysia californica]|uniref:Fibroblast growth factor receptor n=1 Tax=Aplysia californica TaxID=6500 RepID=A0ABM0ZVE3_APLCA|nr:fibroblast growth factor receptor [Aplysia californica]
MHAQALIPARKSGRGGKSTWVQVAIKRTLDVADAEAKQDFLTELSLLRSVPRHSNIVTLYAQCTAREPYLMILEFAPHKDLSTYLQRQRKSHIYSNTASQAGVYSLAGTENGEYTLPWGEEPHYHNPDLVLSGLPDVTRSSPNAQMRSRDLISFAFQTCRGLQHLVNNKIVHRDVAARNLLLFDHGVVKISDFGLARKMDQRNVYVRSRRVSTKTRSLRSAI